MSPPYGSIPSSCQPAREWSGLGLTRRFGLSVCAPTTRNPAAGPAPAPCAPVVSQAMSEPPRTR